MRPFLAALAVPMALVVLPARASEETVPPPPELQSQPAPQSPPEAQPQPAPQPSEPPSSERALSATATGELGYQSAFAIRFAYLPSPKLALGASVAYSIPRLSDDTGVATSICTVDTSVHDWQFAFEARPRLARKDFLEIWLPLELGAVDRHAFATARCVSGDPKDATSNHGGILGGFGLVVAARIGSYVSIDLELRVRAATLSGSGNQPWTGLLPLHTAGLGVTGYLPL